MRDNVGQFCDDLGLSLPRIAEGCRPAIEKLAYVASVDAAQLYSEAFIQKGKRFSFKGQALIAHSLTRDRVRLCPRCCLEDIGRATYRVEARPYRRSSWLIGPIRTCPAHELALVDIGLSSSMNGAMDTSAAIAQVVPKLSEMAMRSFSRPPSAFERYCLDRIDDGRKNQEGSNWLDRMPLHAAMRICGVLGAVALHGPTVILESLSEHQMWACEAAGFDIARDGQAGIRAFLEECRRAFADSRGEWGTRAIYGRLWEWIAHETDDPAYEPLRDILWHHIVETTPVGIGKEILGRRLGQRLTHSIHSASREYGLHPKRLRKLLVETGVISDAETKGLSDEHVVFSEPADGLLSDLSDAMSLNDVRIYGNFPRPHERILYENGFIEPFISGGTDTLKDHCFRRRDVDDFLDRLLGDADPAYFGVTGFFDIPSAAKRACCRAEQVIQLLLDRKLTRVGRNPKVDGYLSVLVDVDELRPLVIGEDHGGVSLRTATGRIRTSDRVLTALIVGHYIKAERVKNAVTKQTQTIIRPAELDRFLREFVGLRVLAEERLEHFRRTKAEMEARGIRPAFDPKVIMATFYRRQDLME